VSPVKEWFTLCSCISMGHRASPGLPAFQAVLCTVPRNPLLDAELAVPVA
jgi:hypothetical protein